MRKPIIKRPWPAPPERFAIDANANIKITDDDWCALIAKWMIAIRALVEPQTGKSDPAILATLLRSETRFPSELMALFAEMIDPEQAAFNGKLVLKRTKAASKREARATQTTKIAMRVTALIRNGSSTEEATMAVADEIGKSQRWVYKEWLKLADGPFWGRAVRKSRPKAEPK